LASAQVVVQVVAEPAEQAASTAARVVWAANTEAVVVAEVPVQPPPVLAVPVAMVSLSS
jgi:hypothetical protein